MTAAVVDAGVVLGWFASAHRSRARIDRLVDASRAGKARVFLSVVNFAEVLKHLPASVRTSGVDPVSLLRAWQVELHAPDEAVARAVAQLSTSLADGFAAATALRIRARLHTTDRELVRQLKGSRLLVTMY